MQIFLIDIIIFILLFFHLRIIFNHVQAITFEFPTTFKLLKNYCYEGSYSETIPSFH